MNYLQNSENTPSWQLKYETKNFQKFGMSFRLCMVIETRDQWARIVLNKKGEVLDPTKPDDLQRKLELGESPTVEWRKTGELTSNEYVQAAFFSDEEDTETKRIELLSTPDGPILGIVIEDTDPGAITLMDPCVVQYDAANGSIKYLPIFNVARTLVLERSAIRSRQAPAEIIVASYPGFILQNRMFQYQLKPTVAFASTEPLDNDALEAEATETIQ